jgi:hypothetical protein
MLLKMMMHLYVPESIKKKNLNELFGLTANAFQSELPELRGLSFDECLRRYASFTKKQAEIYLQSGCPLEEVKDRLYQDSRVFGDNLRHSLHIQTWNEAVATLKAAYKLIGIDFRYCDGQGEIMIKKCFFSEYYSGEVCMLISSLDEGLAAGLTGGRLSIYHRITEGGSCCKGHLGGGL